MTKLGETSIMKYSEDLGFERGGFQREQVDWALGGTRRRERGWREIAKSREIIPFKAPGSKLLAVLAAVIVKPY